MVDFRQRSTAPERMDDPDVPFETLDVCLKQLEYINRGTLAYRPTLRWIARALVSFRPGRPITIFDIGCGGGDMLRRIARWAQTNNVDVTLTGFDINPLTKRIAERRSEGFASLHFEIADIYTLPPTRKADFIISSLFTHHLDDKELTRFLNWMDTHAEQGWLSNDLHRHPIAYYGIKAILAAVPFVNPIVHHDAAVSVARAFTKADWRARLADAGIEGGNMTIDWYLPFRWAVGFRRS